MSVAFLDLHSSYLELKTEIDLAVGKVLGSGIYILGTEVQSFEAEYANFCNTKYAVSVANGFDALVLALRALEIGSGDEVIVPSNTFIATWLAVSAVGAIPIPVEPNLANHTIEVSQISQSITKNTKAIIPVHLYGHPADLNPIISIAKENGLVVIEDAAQAHGARYRGKRIGGHSDAICWSFYPGKNLGAFGDGGCVTTNRQDIAEKVQILRNYGSSKKYQTDRLGVNSRLDPIQAAILRVKLRYLDEWNLRRTKIAQRYRSEIFQFGLTLPSSSAWAEPVWHLFVILIENRDQVQRFLDKAGIKTQIHYPVPPHMQRAYINVSQTQKELPIAQKLSRELLSLPIGPHLPSDAVTRVIKSITDLT